jgi:hypothetical protein
MRNPATAHQRGASDDAAAVAAVAAGGLVAALFALVLAVDELAVLVQHPFAMFPH